jgi:hypothetical protein
MQRWELKETAPKEGNAGARREMGSPGVKDDSRNSTTVFEQKKDQERLPKQIQVEIGTQKSEIKAEADNLQRAWLRLVLLPSFYAPTTLTGKPMDRAPAQAAFNFRVSDTFWSKARAPSISPSTARD